MPAAYRSTRLPLAALLIASLAALLHAGGGGFFHADDWRFVLDRGAWDAGALLRPHDGHPALVPAFAYKLLLETVGIDAYAPYRLLLALSHGVTLIGLFLYARPRVGPFAALLVPASVAVFGAGYPGLLWGFQIGSSVSLLTGVFTFLALDRGTRRGDGAACALLCASLASSAVGLCVLIGVAIEVVGRADRRARWWVVAAPVALYALWWLAYDDPGGRYAFARVDTIAVFTAQGLAATVGALFGQPPAWGRPLALGAIVLLLARARAYTAVPWRLLALLAVPLSLWALAAVTRAGFAPAGAPRLLYPAAVFVLLVASEAAAGVALRRGALVLVSVLVVAAAGANLAQLREGGRELARLGSAARGELGALEIAGPARSDPAAAPAPGVTAGAYFSAVRRFGPAVGGAPALRASAADVRAYADAALQRRFAGAGPAHGPGLGTIPRVESATRVRLARRGPCVYATPAGTATLTLPVPRSGLALAGAPQTAAALRLFGDGFGNTPIRLDRRAPRLLLINDVATLGQWHARLSFTEPLRVCGPAS